MSSSRHLPTIDLQPRACDPRRRSSRLVPSVLALTLLAGACGGGTTKAKPTTTLESTSTTLESTTTLEATTTAVPATSSSVPVTAAADMTAKAKAATLQQGDFPPGFPAQPDDPKSGLHIETLWGELLACLGVPKVQPAGIATSPTFLRGLATQGVSTVEYTTAAAGAAVSTALSAPKFQACSTQAFTADLDRSKPEGSTPGTVSVARRDYAPIGAVKVNAFRINATVLLADLQVKLTQDFFVIFKDTAIIRLFFLNPGADFPQDLQRSLLEKVVGRA